MVVLLVVSIALNAPLRLVKNADGVGVGVFRTSVVWL